jgi:hypothetical protein
MNCTSARIRALFSAARLLHGVLIVRSRVLMSVGVSIVVIVSAAGQSER